MAPTIEAPAAPPLPPHTPACLSFMELSLVLDVSGSMRGVIRDLKSFAHSIVDQFDLGATTTRVSIVSFASGATTLAPLSTDDAAISAATTAACIC